MFDCISHLTFAVSIVYSTYGLKLDFLKTIYPGAPEDRAHTVRFLKKLPELVSTGKIKPNPVKLWPGGLDAINDGLKYMEQGKVSAEKIVYRLK